MNERDANIERYDSLKVNDTFGERIAQSLFIGSDPSLLGFSLSYKSITFANDMKYIYICLHNTFGLISRYLTQSPENIDINFTSILSLSFISHDFQIVCVVDD